MRIMDILKGLFASKPAPVVKHNSALTQIRCGKPGFKVLQNGDIIVSDSVLKDLKG